jgi:hypothetical protein
MVRSRNKQVHYQIPRRNRPAQPRNRFHAEKARFRNQQVYFRLSLGMQSEPLEQQLEQFFG